MNQVKTGKVKVNKLRSRHQEAEEIGHETLEDLTSEKGLGESRGCVLVDLHVVYTSMSKAT